jgi:hypothetical protein
MRCNVDNKTRWLTLYGAVKEGEAGIYGRQWLPDVQQWGAVDGPDELVESFGVEEYWRYAVCIPWDGTEW